MPYASKQRCRTPGCASIVDSGYCARCRASGAAGAPRRNSTQRGYGARWQKASRAFLAAHPLCVDPYAEHAARVVAAQCVDHRVPHRGDMTLFWDSENWQPLCNACHGRKTALEDGGFGHTVKRLFSREFFFAGVWGKNLKPAFLLDRFAETNARPRKNKFG